MRDVNPRQNCSLHTYVPWTVYFLVVVLGTWCADLFLSIFALSVVCASCFIHGNIGKHSLEGSLVVSVSIRIRLIMNHGTILKTVGGLAHDDFHRFCLRLFDYEPWNHIPQVIEGGTCDNHLHL